MKKLINDVSGVVPDMLDRLAALNPGLSLLQGNTIIVRADAEAAAARGEVALISGGDSGHEPAHGGYVGLGMLSAAVAGEVCRPRPMPSSMPFAPWPVLRASF